MRFLYKASRNICLSTLLFCSTFVSAQTVQVTALNFPGPAATSCTNTFLDVSVTLLCINATHTGNTVTVSGTNITVDVEYSLGPICLGALSFPVENVNLGMLAANGYNVTVNGNLKGNTVSTMNTSLTVVSCCAAQPSFTYASDSICIGDSLYFTNNSTGQTSHEWFENNVSQGTSMNYGKLFSMAGSYDIKLVVTDGNCSDSLTRTIVVSTPPSVNLGTDTMICSGSTIVLDAGSGRDSIRWFDMSTSNTFSVNSAGTYWVKVFENGCESSDSITVGTYTVNSINLGNDTTLCQGDSLWLSVAQTGVSYMWQDGSTSSDFLAKADGWYSVTVTDSNQCSVTDSILVTIDTTCFFGLPIETVSNFRVYPNPFSDHITLDVSEFKEEVDVEILTTSGKLVYRRALNTKEKNDFTFNLAEFSKGTYILKLSGQSYSQVKILIKE